MPGADDSDDDREKYDVQFAPGLSDAQRAEAARIVEALRATRSQRHQRADEVAADGELAPMFRMRPTLLATGSPCLLPIVEGKEAQGRGDHLGDRSARILPG